MKHLNKLFLAFFVAILTLTSCEKENVDDSGTTIPNGPETTETSYNPLLGRSSGGGEMGLEFDCFEINYPFSFLLADGSEIEITSETELETVFTPENEIVDFVYPLNVTLENGDAGTAADAEGLAELFAACVPDGGWNENDFPAYQIADENSCYSLTYPVSLENLEGEVITVADDVAFNAALAEEIYFFVWPLDLVHEDGEAVTVNGVDELFEVLLSCNEWDWEVNDTINIWEWESGFEYLGCYMVAFPLAVIVDGETVTVENHEELCDLMLQGHIEDYAFPMTLTDEDGNIVTVTDEEALEQLLAECWDFPVFVEDLFLLFLGSQNPNPGESVCYEIEFPISTYENDFQQATVFTNQEELEQGIIQGGYFCCLEYPVSVVLTSDTSTVVLESEADLFQLIEECD